MKFSVSTTFYRCSKYCNTVSLNTRSPCYLIYKLFYNWYFHSICILYMLSTMELYLMDSAIWLNCLSDGVIYYTWLIFYFEWFFYIDCCLPLKIIWCCCQDPEYCVYTSIWYKYIIRFCHQFWDKTMFYTVGWSTSNSRLDIP